MSDFQAYSFHVECADQLKFANTTNSKSFHQDLSSNGSSDAENNCSSGSVPFSTSLSGKKKDTLKAIKTQLAVECDAMEASVNSVWKSFNREGSNGSKVSSSVLLCDISDSEVNDSDNEDDTGAKSSKVAGGSTGNVFRKRKRVLLVAPQDSRRSRVIRFSAPTAAEIPHSSNSRTVNQAASGSTGLLSEALVTRRCVSVSNLRAQLPAVSQSADGVAAPAGDKALTALPLYCAASLDKQQSPKQGQLVASSEHGAHLFGLLVTDGHLDTSEHAAKLSHVAAPHVQRVADLWGFLKSHLAVHQRTVLAKAVKTLRSLQASIEQSSLKHGVTHVSALQSGVHAILTIAAQLAAEMCGGTALVDRVVALLVDPSAREFKLVASHPQDASSVAVRVDLAGACAEKSQPVLWHSGLTSPGEGEASNCLTVPIVLPTLGVAPAKGSAGTPHAVIQLLNIWPGATGDLRRTLTVLTSLVQFTITATLQTCCPLGSTLQGDQAGILRFEQNKPSLSSIMAINAAANPTIIPLGDRKPSSSNCGQCGHVMNGSARLHAGSVLSGSGSHRTTTNASISRGVAFHDSPDPSSSSRLRGSQPKSRFSLFSSSTLAPNLTGGRIVTAEDLASIAASGGRKSIQAHPSVAGSMRLLGLQRTRSAEVSTGRDETVFSPVNGNFSVEPPTIEDLILEGKEDEEDVVELVPVDALIWNSTNDDACCTPLRDAFEIVKVSARELWVDEVDEDSDEEGGVKGVSTPTSTKEAVPVMARMSMRKTESAALSNGFVAAPDETLMMLFDDATFTHQLVKHTQGQLDGLLYHPDTCPTGVQLLIPPRDAAPMDAAVVDSPMTLLDWEFNPFLFSHAGLCKMTTALLVKNLAPLFPDPLQVPVARVRTLVDATRELYFDNFYHGFAHGVCVLGVVALLLHQTAAGRAITPIEAAAALVGGLLHDVGHPGTNNEFSVKRGARVALTFVSSGVLESLHASIATELVATHGILEALGPNAQAFRSAMVTSILATDMTRHGNLNEFLSMARLDSLFFPDAHGAENVDAACRQPGVAAQGGALEKPSNAMKELVIQHLVKAGDLSNPVLSKELCIEWAKRICIEFHLQFKSEKNLGLEPNPMINVNPTDPAGLARNQFGFISFVVKPYWSNLNQSFGGLQDRVKQVLANEAYWQGEIKRATEEKEKQAAAAAAQ